MTCANRLRPFLDIAIELFRPDSDATRLITHIQPSVNEDLRHAQQTKQTLTEAHFRVVWMIYLGDIYAAANGRRRNLQDIELSSVPLPGPEVIWQRKGIAGASGQARSTLNSQVGTGSDIGNLGHVIKIVSFLPANSDLQEPSLI